MLKKKFLMKIEDILKDDYEKDMFLENMEQYSERLAEIAKEYLSDEVWILIYKTVRKILLFRNFFEKNRFL